VFDIIFVVIINITPHTAVITVIITTVIQRRDIIENDRLPK